MPVDVIELSSSPELASRALARPTTKPTPRTTSPSEVTNRDGNDKKSSTLKSKTVSRISKATNTTTKRSRGRPQASESDSDGFDFQAHVYKKPIVTAPTSVRESSSSIQNPAIEPTYKTSNPIHGLTCHGRADSLSDKDEAYINEKNIKLAGHTGWEGQALDGRLRQDDLQNGKAPKQRVPNSNPAVVKSLKSTEPTKLDWGVDFKSDDFDTSLDLDSSHIKSTPDRYGLLGLDRKQMEAERLARFARLRNVEVAIPKEIQELKRKVTPILPSSGREIMEILDDSEDEVLPPPKKRQLSPTGSTIPKSSGYRRCISNIEPTAKIDIWKSKASNLVRSKSNLEPDPIVFTSSPNPIEEAALKRTARRTHIFSDSDDPFASDFGITPKAFDKTIKDSYTAPSDSDEDFPDIDNLPPPAASKPKPVPSHKSPPKFKDPTKPKSKPKQPTTAFEEYNAEKVKENKAKERKLKAQARELKTKEKEDEKERKRIAREEKAFAKNKAAELAKVNILRTDKKVSTPEMLVDLPVSDDAKSSLDGLGKAQGQFLATKARTFLDTLGVQVSDYANFDPVVRWRRRVTAAFNEESGIWEPVEEHIKVEKHIMYVITAKEFVELAGGDEDNDLDNHTIRLKTKYRSNDIIYLIQGLTKWMRDNKNVKNRKFQAAARSYGQEELTATGKPRKKKPEPEYVDENMVEEALLKLQVMHGMVIHHTRDLQDTSEAIRAFTQHISTIPYKLQQQAMDTTFCMESGQVKAGDGAADTFIKMLQEMVRVTPAVAHGIAAEFSTVQKLAKAFQESGPSAVAECKKSANKNGAFTDRLVGPAISKRLYTVFTGRDEWAENV